MNGEEVCPAGLGVPSPSPKLRKITEQKSVHIFRFSSPTVAALPPSPNLSLASYYSNFYFAVTATPPLPYTCMPGVE